MKRRDLSCKPLLRLMLLGALALANPGNASDTTIPAEAWSLFALPITTPSLQPGDVTPHAQSLPHLRQPLFMVGADPRSRRWLVARRQELIALGAVGMLVQVADHDELNTMRELAQGLVLVPVSAEAIAGMLGLRHYPVLISSKGWEQ